MVERESVWNPKAELKTAREYGFGFAQTTIAYNKDGSVRFNRFNELKQSYKELKDWEWDNRFDPKMNFIALTLTMQSLHHRFDKLAKTDQDAWRMSTSAYNGGSGDVMKAIMACRRNEFCDDGVWYDNIELHINKSRQKWKGYGLSAYETNINYVKFVDKKAPEYKQLWGSFGDGKSR